MVNSGESTMAVSNDVRVSGIFQIMRERERRGWKV